MFSFDFHFDKFRRRKFLALAFDHLPSITMQRDTSSNLIPRFFYAGFSPGSDAFAAALFGLVHFGKIMRVAAL
jgi:hypothetical protein